MKSIVSQGGIPGPIIILAYTVELHYVIKSIGDFYHVTQVIPDFFLVLKATLRLKNKLGVIFDKVDQWRRSRRLKLNSDKTDRIFVTEKNCMRKIVDIDSVMLRDIPVQFSNTVRNLGVVFDN